MKVCIGDIVRLCPGVPYADMRIASGIMHQEIVGQMTTGSLAVVLEVSDYSGLEVRVLSQDNTIGWVLGSCLRPIRSKENTIQEKVK